MLDPLTALSVAGNVIQLIDFSYQLVSEGNKIYHSANGASQENKTTDELASNLAKLTSSVLESQNKWLGAHGDNTLDPDETRLRNICDKCTEIAKELNDQLQKLKLEDGAKHRRLKSFKLALVSSWKKDAIDEIAVRLEKYQQELNTHVLVGLRKSAAEADVKHSRQFAALDRQQKDLTLAVLDGGKKTGSRLDDQAAVLARIQDSTSQILSTMELEQRRRSPSPLPAYEAVQGSGWTSTPLHEAAKCGDILKVRQILRSPGLEVNARDEHGCTPLQLSSSLDVAKRLLTDKRIDINIEDSEGRSALHYAVLRRRLDVIKILLEAGIEKDLEDDRGRTAALYAIDCPTASWLLRYGPNTEVRAEDHLNNTGLIQMAWLGDAEGTNFFLCHGADINALNSWHETALTESSRHGDLAIVEMLVARKANMELRAGNEWTPLCQAVRDKRAEVVRLLLKAGADKEAKLKNNNTPLAEACWRSHFEIALILAENGANVEAIVHQYNTTPLLVAASGGQVGLTKILLERGAKKEALDPEGASAVYLAARTGHAETLRALLDHGANVNIRKIDGSTALSVAAQFGCYDAVKLLLQSGANPNTVGAKGSGYTPLLEAAHHGHVETVRLLLDKGAKWESGSNSGFGAVSVAAHQGRTDVIRVLFERGADLEQSGYGSRDPELSVTPLMRAAMFGHATTVALLLDLGAKVNAQDAQGQTALILAVKHKRDECVNVLIKRGVDLNIQTAKGETALMHAASQGSEKSVDLLLQYKADPLIRDWRGMTAWTFAVHTAHDEALGHLLKPTHDENNTLQQLQAERHPSEIAAYLDENYFAADRVFPNLSWEVAATKQDDYTKPCEPSPRPRASLRAPSDPAHRLQPPRMADTRAYSTSANARVTST